MPSLARRAIRWTGEASRPRIMKTPSADCSSGLAFPARTRQERPWAIRTTAVNCRDRAILKAQPEGRFKTNWREIRGSYGDGETYTLIQPEYSFDELAYGELHPEIMASPRIAPVAFGVGLLEAIPESDIQAMADPDDEDGDGISGRANMVWDVIEQRTRLGRFGWKANVPTVEQQVAGAFPRRHRHNIHLVSPTKIVRKLKTTAPPH